MDDAFTIEVTNLEPLLAALDEWPDIVQPELHDAAEASLLNMVGPMMAYPDEPPGSTYDRTMTLGRTWNAAVPEFGPMGEDFEARLSNPTPYGPYVQDEVMQAWMHQGRWQTAQEVVLNLAPDTEAYFNRALDNVAAKIEAAGGS